MTPLGESEEKGEDGSGEEAASLIATVGAGQDVGRSCILVSIGGKNIMFDCGMHMGYNVSADRCFALCCECTI